MVDLDAVSFNITITSLIQLPHIIFDPFKLLNYSEHRASIHKFTPMFLNYVKELGKGGPHVKESEGS